jgi:CBS domain-containing protein
MAAVQSLAQLRLGGLTSTSGVQLGTAHTGKRLTLSVVAAKGRTASRERAVVTCKVSMHKNATRVEDASEEGAILPSGEWPENFSMLSYEDLCAYYEPIVFKEMAQPDTSISGIMSKHVWTAYPHTSLSEIQHRFQNVTGIPVIDEGRQCVGVLSRKDLKAGIAGDTKVGDLMSKPAITISMHANVKDAAVLMLRNKVHRLPVVNGTNQVVGIVTRTDIFKALGNSA